MQITKNKKTTTNSKSKKVVECKKVSANSQFMAGHRQRLKSKFKQNKLEKYEMLELLLSYAVPRRDTKQLSKMLLHKFDDSIHKILTAQPEELQKFKGVGEHITILLNLISTISSLKHSDILKKESVLDNWSTLEKYISVILMGKKKEEIHCICLDINFIMIDHITHTIGYTDRAYGYLEEIVRTANINRSAYVMLVHNHPSGSDIFSEYDFDFTKEIYRALKVINITLYDHILVSGSKVKSMRNTGLLKALLGIEY
ncbi:MAG: RadC family protein [Alphaproteobacteria bacterium]|nr:RadC family protein [Alphaproteobacteria bacterium]MBL0717717.1 RadC family protein [Alphaproteobacteria bacterium]